MSRTMTNRLALAAILVACTLGCAGGSNAQTKAPPAYWVTETLAVKDRDAFLNATKAVPPIVKAYGGRYIVLGGKIVPGVGSPPARITIIAFDSLEQAEKWFNDPAAVAARTEAQKYATVRDYTVEGLGN
jgi:uncharacterized protein (DUF1330 family)